MSDAFYKTSDPAVLAALSTYEAEASAVIDAGKVFAAHYGGKPLTKYDTIGCSVAGLRFSPAKDDPLWTKPDAQCGYRQQPRASLRKATKEQRQALAALLVDWRARYPSTKADRRPLWEAMGTDWGSLYFCGIAIFQHDGSVYVSTSAKLAPCMHEILSSEYNAAWAAYESVKEAA